MGGLLSYLWSRNISDIPDPATGLSPLDIHLVTKTWAIVRTDLKTHGVNILKEFFVLKPESQSRFTAFATLPFDEMTSNSRFQAHALAVMYSLTSLIDTLDETGCLVEMLTKIGANHGKRNIEEEEFKLLQRVIVDYLEKNLGSSWNERTKQAWNSLLDVALKVIFANLKKT